MFGKVNIELDTNIEKMQFLIRSTNTRSEEQKVPLQPCDWHRGKLKPYTRTAHGVW